MKKDSIIVLEEEVFFCIERTINGQTLQLILDNNYNKGKGKKANKCPICKKELENNDRVTFVITNNKLFPNVWVHDKCLAEKGKKNACIQMHEDYEKVKELISIWG